MLTLHKLHTTVLLLKGQQACNEFGTLLRLWEGLLKAEEFSRFVFVFTEDIQEPTGISEAVFDTLKSSTFIISKSSFDLPKNVIEEVFKRKTSKDVLVQSIISDFSDAKTTLLSLSNLAKRLGSDTGIILYLLLRDDDPEASADQRAFLLALSEEMAEAGQTKFYPYLLSHRDAQNVEISKSAKWRALSHEVLVNSASLRALTAGRMYSLGYSVINADDSELSNLLEYRMEEMVEEVRKKETSPPYAWRLITLNAAIPEATGNNIPQHLVTQWVHHIIKELISPPSQVEKMNNRVLGRVVTIAPEGIRQAIKTFYDINWSDKNWSDFQKEYIGQLKDRLRHSINATSFPREMISQVTERLSVLAEARLESIPIPPKKFFETSKAYANKVAEAMEKGYQEQVVVRLSAGCAKALISCLKEFDGFINQSKLINKNQRLHMLDSAQIESLKTKFKPYWDAIMQVGYVKENGLLLGEVEKFGPYYTNTGEAIPDAWRSLIERGARQLRDALPGAMSGNFVTALGEMFTDSQELSSFFKEYLLGSQRMLYNVHDARASVQTRLFVDKAFESHPWIASQGHPCLITDNDNIEQIDLYELEHNAAWYMKDQNSPYFSSEMPFSSNGIKAVRPWRGTTQDYIPIDDGIQPVQQLGGNQEVHEQELAMCKMGNNYLLTWIWKPGALSAKVTIESANGKPVIHLCDHAKFAANQGLLVSNHLPYGEIRVSIHCDGVLYAQKTLSGRSNTVRYKIEFSNNGYSELFIQGSVQDIRQLVLLSPRSDQKSVIYYPINPKHNVEVQRFGELTLHLRNKTRLVPYPHDKYPKVEALYNDSI